MDQSVSLISIRILNERRKLFKTSGLLYNEGTISTISYIYRWLFRRREFLGYVVTRKAIARRSLLFNEPFGVFRSRPFRVRNSGAQVRGKQPTLYRHFYVSARENVSSVRGTVCEIHTRSSFQKEYEDRGWRTPGSRRYKRFVHERPR